MYKSLYKKNWITIKLEEDLRLSDFQKHAGLSDFTKKWKNERLKIKGPANKSAKLVKMVINFKKDYIKFFFLAEPTYTFDTKVTKPKKMSLVPDNLYTQIIMLNGIFKLLKTKPKFKTYKDITLQEIKDAIKISTTKVHCDCPSLWWQGLDYYLTILDGAVYPCEIKPKFWNKKHKDGDGIVCKHLDLILASIAFFTPVMAGMIKKYLANK